MRKPGGSAGPNHTFGGDWTETKLQVVASYLSAYTTALKDQPFSLGYIDAFAGTGYRQPRKTKASKMDQLQLALPDMAAPEPGELLDGSARLALQTEPRFHKYIFIDSMLNRCKQLESLRGEFPHLADDIIVRQDEANSAIQDLCKNRTWRQHRAVLFLDPYGMQVEWETVAAVAETKAIDLWLLVPLGIGLNRLLKKSGDIPAPWRDRITSLLGTDDWFEAFYKVEHRLDLFGNLQEEVVKASGDAIGRFFVQRLQEVFPAVASTPGVLRNTKNCPLYLLCFAAGNERGGNVALRIANHLLKGVW